MSGDLRHDTGRSTGRSTGHGTGRGSGYDTGPARSTGRDTGRSTGHDIKVQAVEPGHLDALLALCREHAAYEKADFHDNGQVERWRSALFAEPAALYGWIATDGGEPCGFMTVTIDFATWSAAPFAYMDCLYLREPYRGLGLGRMFFEQLREFAAAHGCGWAEWQTPPDNELGIGFYQRMGATAKAKSRFHYDVGGVS